jgi:outer membrane protein OmpA-like peptidoglycan-associated protein/tetratricopeptide (TPR) repeat protein
MFLSAKGFSGNRAAVMTLAFLAFGFSLVQAQNQNKAAQKADKLFQYQNYGEAIKLYDEALSEGAASPDIYYRLGKSYFESAEINDKVRSIEYLEKALQLSISPVPRDFYLNLGDAYHLNEQPEQALTAYNKHLSQGGLNESEKLAAAQRLEKAKNAHRMMREAKDIRITRLNTNINSAYTEYNPVVSADESVLAYTALRPNDGRRNTMDKFVEEILISRNETGNWSDPVAVPVATQSNYGTAGLSADGQEMLIFIGDRRTGSLYTISREQGGWTRPVSIGAINSKNLESTASLTPDGKTIYFASNRPGGYGGLDIYKATKKSDGTWSNIKNLGPTVNTKADEEAPFIHPNGTMLFFTSDGHDGMGGFDIFKCVQEGQDWSVPVNMGYPVNTSANDSYFTLIADGSRGYFSSDRKGGAGGQDIYMMDMPDDFETIPLTMIKGRILESATERPLPTKIYVIDNSTNQKLDFVYHPNKETGDYLIILPPSKSYDMIIESDGFLPYTLNIDVPNQTYFYELYQKIHLSTIKHFDVVVGQEVEVKNAFYNTQAAQVADLRKEHEATLVQQDSIDVYELMGDLIEAGDQHAIDYVVELIMAKNPIDAVNFDDNNNERLQAAKRVYFYDESDESKFEKKNVGNDVIFSLPTFNVTQAAEEQRNGQMATRGSYEKSLLGTTLKVFFDADASELSKNYQPKLDEILKILKDNPALGVEISGYASAEGDEEYNKKLSNQRAISVLDYINHRGIVRRRIIAKGFGASAAGGASKEESRRVEVRIVDLEKSAS